MIAMAYTIKTKKGVNLGIYEGNSQNEAFINLMRNGGYTEEQVWLEDEEVCYYSADDMLMCGKPEDYQIIPI